MYVCIDIKFSSEQIKRDDLDFLNQLLRRLAPNSDPMVSQQPYIYWKTEPSSVQLQNNHRTSITCQFPKNVLQPTTSLTRRKYMLTNPWPSQNVPKKSRTLSLIRTETGLEPFIRTAIAVADRNLWRVRSVARHPCAAADCSELCAVDGRCSCDCAGCSDWSKPSYRCYRLVPCWALCARFVCAASTA